MSERARGRWSAGRFDLGLTFTKHSVWTFKIYIFFNLKGKKTQSRSSCERELDSETHHTVAENNTTGLKITVSRVQAVCVCVCVLLRIAITGRFKRGRRLTDSS